MSQWSDAMKVSAAYGLPLLRGHAIQSDIDFVGTFLFETPTDKSLRHKKDGSDRGVDPQAIVEDESQAEQDSDLFSPQPPPVSGYRCPADIQGMACWNCAHFLVTGDDDNDGVPDGICNLWEAHADGAATCDRFTAHADLLRQAPHTSWQEDMADQNAMQPSVTEVSYSDDARLNSILLSGAEAVEEDGLIWKDIMRTGEWSHTPTGKGVVARQLRITDEGDSDPENGVISLDEIYRNFEENAVNYVTVPLSDEVRDHKNIARLNTGFVRKLKLVKRDDGRTVLRAGIDFTEPDVKGKVLRGTIPDVSAGVPFGVTRRRDNRVFGTVLDHVCLTRKPFMDGLGPFSLAAADGEEPPVEVFGEVEAPESAPSETTPPQPSQALSFRQYQAAIRKALTNQLRLSPDYEVEDVRENIAIICHRTSKACWEVSFRIANGDAVLAGVDQWALVDGDNGNGGNSTTRNLVAADPLQQAHQMRELRLSQPTSQTGGINMSTGLSLEGVELSELPEEARAGIQRILDKSASLERENRESRVNTRISELEGLGLKSRPGALRLYRQVMLSDDEGPAVVLFSDSDDEDKKERLTATQILDRFINALAADGGVNFSDQHLASGNDTKPPADPSNEVKPFEERVAEAREAIHGKRGARRYAAKNSNK